LDGGRAVDGALEVGPPVVAEHDQLSVEGRPMAAEGARDSRELGELIAEPTGTRAQAHTERPS
jgi:hypothetical protein